MAKKEKEETPNPNVTPNRDIAQRLNFLYQASVYLQSIAPTKTQVHSNKGKQREEGRDANSAMMDVDVAPSNKISGPPTGKKHGRRIRKKHTTGDLARSYIQSMRVVGQKTTVKIDPSLKRSLCSTCNTTLVPGSSAKIRVKNSSCHGQIVIYTCLNCKTAKRIPASSIPSSGSAALDVTDDPAPGVSPPHDFNPQTQQISPVSQNRGDEPSIHMKKPRKYRSLPLSARQDAGHVVFRGNERLDLDKEGGSGVCFT